SAALRGGPATLGAKRLPPRQHLLPARWRAGRHRLAAGCVLAAQPRSGAWPTDASGTQILPPARQDRKAGRTCPLPPDFGASRPRKLMPTSRARDRPVGPGRIPGQGERSAPPATRTCGPKAGGPPRTLLGRRAWGGGRGMTVMLWWSAAGRPGRRPRRGWAGPALRRLWSTGLASLATRCAGTSSARRRWTNSPAWA